jgi:hypothetical protein
MEHRTFLQTVAAAATASISPRHDNGLLGACAYPQAVKGAGSIHVRAKDRAMTSASLFIEPPIIIMS